MAYKELLLDYGTKEKIYGNEWIHDNKADVKGNVVIIHGMAEYSMRYKDFAEFLFEKGYNVYAADHIGHGLAVSKDPEARYKYGMWPLDGFDQCIERVYAVVQHVHMVSDKPVFVFGHSLGSFLATGYYERHSDSVKAVVICGSAYNNGTYKASTTLTNLMKPFKKHGKEDQPVKMITNVQNKTLNKGIKPFPDNYVSVNNWLSFNEENVKKYDKDPECGFACSFNFYYSMFHGQQKIWKKSALKQIKEPKPLFVIAGAEDPVGANGKDVKNLYKFLSNYQKDVTLHLYPNRRHEILNDDGKEEVYGDILDFFNKNL
jgi:alpha-beta hydrolase superfamily lysophospholipase